MMQSGYEAEFRVRVKLEADSEEAAREILTHHIHRMVKFREAEFTEVIPVQIRPAMIESRSTGPLN